MTGSQTCPDVRSVPLPDPAATEALARDYAAGLRRGDVLALTGDLGTGKSVFARALILERARMAGVDIGPVPSPTFTIVQQYDLPGFPIYHFDLYRLADADEVWETGIEEAFAEGASLIEWADRIADFLPDGAVHIHLAYGDGDTDRTAQITGTAR